MTALANRPFLHVALAAILLSLPPAALRAELTVEINQGIQGGIPIAIVPLEGAGPGANLAAIAAKDLHRSGRFRVLPEAQMPQRPTGPDQVQWAVWQGLGLDYLVTGQVQAGGNGRHAVAVQLLDAVKGGVMGDYRDSFAEADSRKAAHRMADWVYQKLTGQRGAFASQIAFVTANAGRYALQISDVDGYGQQTVVSSPEPIMSPAWSPDGRKIAYVSFESQKPAIYIQTLDDGGREKIPGHPGINGAPAWSPDGSQLAMSLSKDGSPDIYVLNLASRALRRVTDHPAIDTEPAWSKDGRELAFTSDRGGKPQLYAVPANGGEVRRLTFAGDYNAQGRFAPDGNSLTLLHGTGGDFRIAVMALSGQPLRVLTAGSLDKSPSFAPNGGMILYAAGGRLNTVSLQGGVVAPLEGLGSGSVSAAAWSP